MIYKHFFMTILSHLAHNREDFLIYRLDASKVKGEAAGQSFCQIEIVERLQNHN